MELYQLRSFLAVTEEHQLTKAGERLHISQPAISAHIKTLEDELGVLLFTRTPKGMKPTKEGLLLAMQARKGLKQIDNLVHQAAALKQGLNGVVKIGINTYPDTLRLNEFLSFMANDYPNVECHLFQGNSQDIPRKIREDELDIGFVYSNRMYEGLEVLPLRDCELVVVGPASWKDRMQQADWHGLGRFPWVGTFGWCAFHQVMQDIFQKYAISPEIVTIADGETVLKNLVIGGTGLTLLTSDDALSSEKQGEIAVWKAENFPIRLSCVYAAGRDFSPILKAVVRSIEIVWKDRICLLKTT